MYRKLRLSIEAQYATAIKITFAGIPAQSYNEMTVEISVEVRVFPQNSFGFMQQRANYGLTLSQFMNFAGGHPQLEMVLVRMVSRPARVCGLFISEDREEGCSIICSAAEEEGMADDPGSFFKIPTDTQ